MTHQSKFESDAPFFIPAVNVSSQLHTFLPQDTSTKVEVLSNSTLEDILHKGCKGVEYQPIIDIGNMTIFGYEGLARFYSTSGEEVSPEVIFASLHKSPNLLFEYEYLCKQFQLEHAPAYTKVFINLDQDSFFSYSGNSKENPLLNLFIKYKDRLVVEITENSKIIDAIHSQKAITVLAQNGISTAIDDALKPNSIFSSSILLKVDFIKLDKYVVGRDYREKVHLMNYVYELVDHAHQMGKRVILEGVENLNDLAFARDLCVDFVQGFHFRDKFKIVKTASN